MTTLLELRRYHGERSDLEDSGRSGIYRAQTYAAIIISRLGAGQSPTRELVTYWDRLSNFTLALPYAESIGTSSSPTFGLLVRPILGLLAKESATSSINRCANR